MIKIINFGKIKEQSYELLRQEYVKRASQLGKIVLIELKNQDAEAKIKRYKKEHSEEEIHILSEEGKIYTSATFAQLLQSASEKTLTFVVGPAEGFSKEFKKEFYLLSLSSLTMMHDLAHVVLVEQIYRGLTINKGLPYHKP